MKAGQREPALASLVAGANAGDAAKQNWLGVALDFGTCAEKDTLRAAQWIQKAAVQGSAVSQHNLGVMYANGQGVAKDERLAVDWYRKAAEQGDADAQSNLGAIYEAGTGTLQDAAEAAALYGRAAQQDNAWGQRNLALMLRDGLGVARNPLQTHACFNLASAAAKPHPNAPAERDALAAALTLAQLADAQRLPREWKVGAALGQSRVRVAAAPAPRLALIRVANAGPYPARPAAQPGRTTCSTRCLNGDCFRTYNSGRQVHFQAKHIFHLNPAVTNPQAAGLGSANEAECG